MSISNMQVLEHLRNLRPVERVVPTLEQVQAALQAVRDAEPLAVTLRRAEFSDWTALDLIGTVEALGKYLAQQRKSAVRGHIISWDQSGMLFPLSQQDIAEIKKSFKSRTAGSKKTRSLLPSGTEQDTVVVYIPQGWAPIELGRDVTQSVATAVVSEVTDAEIVRFLDRHYRRAALDLTADHVYLLVWLAEQGLLSRLGELTAAEASLAAVLVQAWDLLEVSAQDAKRGLEALAEADRTGTWDLEELEAHCQRAHWIHPGEVDRVLKVVQSLKADPSNQALRKIVAARIRSFGQLARRSSILAEAKVPEQINVAQAQLICAGAGLLSGEAEEKVIRAEIRDRLTEMGLGNDLDREIGEGVRAWKLGLLDEFYTTRQSRSEGDLEWSANWEQALEGAGAVR